MNKTGMKKVIVGCEPTGSYWLTFQKFLQEHHQAGSGLITKAHTVADNVRQGFNWCWITGVLSKQ